MLGKSEAIQFLAVRIREIELTNTHRITHHRHMDTKVFIALSRS
jgi:hypothetical protein